VVVNVFCCICAYFQTTRIKFFKTIFFNVWSGKKRALMHLHILSDHHNQVFEKRYFLTSEMVKNVFWCICTYFLTTKIKFFKKIFFNVWCGYQRVFTYLRILPNHQNQVLKKRYFLTSEVVNVFWCICAYFRPPETWAQKWCFWITDVLYFWCISRILPDYQNQVLKKDIF
jgi:hypothetical protein